MKDLVANFPKQLQEALNIAEQSKISAPKKSPKKSSSGKLEDSLE